MPFEGIKGVLSNAVSARIQSRTPEGRAYLQNMELRNRLGAQEEMMFPLKMLQLTAQIDELVHPEKAVERKLGEEQRLANIERATFAYQQGLLTKRDVIARSVPEPPMSGARYQQELGMISAKESAQAAANPKLPLTQTPEGAKLLMSFQDKAIKLGEDYTRAEYNMRNIESAYTDFLQHGDVNRIATDQAIIQSFNKVLDPTSVTRIEEYQRTPNDEAVLRKAKAYYDKISKSGGSGISKESISEIVNVSRNMVELQRKAANARLGKMVRTPAAKYGFDPEEAAPTFQPIPRTEPPPPGKAVSASKAGSIGDDAIDAHINQHLRGAGGGY